jgi:hypothetical protein
MKENLQIGYEIIDQINQFFLKDDNPVMEQLFSIIEKYGGPERINRKARSNGRLELLLEQVRQNNPEYAENLAWLKEQRDSGKFISMDAYREKVGGREELIDRGFAVTLEISSLHYFSWLISEARQAVEKGELMPARFIRVRSMKEQEQDGDLMATISAMHIIGASWVESLDTKGTDGSNVHLGGAETITGYFGGIGQPNDYVFRWIDEFLYYYTNYGVRQVLNLNGGTILAGYLLYKLGIDIEFKISVFMGIDNPFSALWTLLTAKLFTRDDGTTPLIGLNFSNSVNNETLEISGNIREALGMENMVRIEHHILESYKSIVVQPYDRLEELLQIARKVKNISAKHEGGIPDVEKERSHPSDVLDYFLPKTDAIKSGIMPDLERNYLDKHDALQRTASALLGEAVPVVAAPLLHR